MNFTCKLRKSQAILSTLYFDFHSMNRNAPQGNFLKVPIFLVGTERICEKHNFDSIGTSCKVDKLEPIFAFISFHRFSTN